MSLSNFIKKIDNHAPDGHSPRLGETMPSCIETNNLLYTSDDELVHYLYNKSFNAYSLELTISPKSSKRLQKQACCTCGATSLMSPDEQQDILLELIEQLIRKFKFNILGVIELYKDGRNVHLHAVMNNQKESKLKKIKKYIMEYYGLSYRCAHIEQLKSKNKYLQYIIKDPYSEFFYYDSINEKPIEVLLRDLSTHNEFIKNNCECVFIECKSCIDYETSVSDKICTRVSNE